MALFTLAKKSIAVAAAGASVYVTYKKGVWSDGKQSKKAWEELTETLSNTSTSSSKPVASALQTSRIRLVSTETLKTQWNRQLYAVFFGAARAVGSGGLVHRIKVQVSDSLQKVL